MLQESILLLKECYLFFQGIHDFLVLVQGYGLLVSRFVLGNWLFIVNFLHRVGWLWMIFLCLVAISMRHLGLILCLKELIVMLEGWCRLLHIGFWLVVDGLWLVVDWLRVGLVIVWLRVGRVVIIRGRIPREPIVALIVVLRGIVVAVLGFL